MGKIIQFANLNTELKVIKQKDDRIILAGGCFDIIHQGHLEFLKRAKALGGKLIILLESDENVRKYKGLRRPIHTQKVRAKILSFIKPVDIVICLPPINQDLEYFDLVKTLQPAIIAISHCDPLISLKREQAKTVKGSVVEVTNRLPYSTSEIVKKLNKK